MALFTEGAMELDIKQTNLMFDIASHEILSMTDMFVESCYMEDGSTDEEKQKASSDKKTIWQTIVEKIRGMIDKVRDIIAGFKASIGGKNAISAEDYMNSETAQVELQYDIMAMQKEIDQEYLEARKIVSSISSVTNVPIEKVAAFCDKMDAKLHANKDKFIPAGKAIIKAAAIDQVRKNVYKTVANTDELMKQSNKYLDEFDRTVRGPQADKIPDDTQKKANALTRFVSTMGKMGKRWEGNFTKATRTINRMSGPFNKEYAKEMRKNK